MRIFETFLIFKRNNIKKIGYIICNILSMAKFIIIWVFLFISVFANAIIPVPVNYTDFNSFGEFETGGIQISAPCPNPVYDFTIIKYYIPRGETAEIAVYNFMGLKQKSVIINGNENFVELDCTDLENGVYFVCLIYQGKNVDSKKMIKN